MSDPNIAPLVSSLNDWSSPRAVLWGIGSIIILPLNGVKHIGPLPHISLEHLKSIWASPPFANSNPPSSVSGVSFIFGIKATILNRPVDHVNQLIRSFATWLFLPYVESRIDWTRNEVKVLMNFSHGHNGLRLSEGRSATTDGPRAFSHITAEESI